MMTFDSSGTAIEDTAHRAFFFCIGQVLEAESTGRLADARYWLHRAEEALNALAEAARGAVN